MQIAEVFSKDFVVYANVHDQIIPHTHNLISNLLENLEDVVALNFVLLGDNRLLLNSGCHL